MAQQPLNVRDSEVRISGDLDDVQRLVVSPYAHLPWTRYLLLRVDDAPDLPAVRSWLASLVPRLATAAHRPVDLALNVALTAEGLLRLGASTETMATFGRAFRQGMASEYRSRLLGDTGASGPDRWAWGGATQPHLLLAVYARTDTGLVAAADAAADAAGRAGVHVSSPPIDALLLPNGIEHFGFTDGVSQPVLAGTAWARRATAPEWESIAPGEFLFGHRDEFGFLSEGPSAGSVDLGRNGSYLVLRQLEQHVERFRSYVQEAAAARGTGPEDVAAELVGRRPDGRSLALGAPSGSATLNDFGYEHDKEGLGCPLGAHVRRANPRNATSKPDARAEEAARRSSNRHRILRRGRPYGPTDESRHEDEPRGLVFIALNADLERQFEFVQHTWLNNPTFAGLCGELDPLTAEHPVGSAVPGGSFTVPARPVRDRLRGLPSFTTTRGGAYFFLPGIRALGHIAAGDL